MHDRVALVLLVFASATAGVHVQTQSRLEFEVASIHQSPPSASTGGLKMDGAQIHVKSFTLREYVARAYRVPPSHVAGPEWIASALFDVDAKLPAGATTEQIPEMLQALLADRFGLQQHHEQREMPMYALMLGKPPLKLKDSPRRPDSAPQTQAPVNVTVAAAGTGGVSVDLGGGASYSFSNGRFDGTRMTAAMIAATFERFSDRRVLDMTGLAGTYDVSFELAPEAAQLFGLRAAVNAGIRLPPQALSLLDTGGNPLLDAVEQLGLKLDARTGPVDVLVVDAARRVPIEN